MFQPAARTRVNELAVLGMLRMLQCLLTALSSACVAIQPPPCTFPTMRYSFSPIATGYHASIPFSQMTCVWPMPMPLFSYRCTPSR